MTDNGLDDHDAERLVVSYLLTAEQDRDGAGELIGRLTEDHFTHATLRAAFHGVRHAWTEGIPLSTASVTDALQQLGFPKPRHKDLVKLSMETPSSLDAAKAAFSRIKELNRWRELLSLGDMVRNAYRRGGITVDSVLQQAQMALDELREGSTAEVQDMGQILTRRVEELVAANGKPVRRIMTGFAPLDQLVGGLGESDLIILAAATGGGKSAFASHVFCSMAMGGHNVLVGSAEMQGWELGDRLMSGVTRVPLSDIRDNRLDANDISNLSKTSGVDAWKRIYVLERDGALTIQRLGMVARMLQRRVGLSMVVVDYLQLISSIQAPGERGRTREAEVAAVARGLKNLAMDMRVPVLALSQFNRKYNADEEPELSHLRESGEIEQAANMVLFLWQDPDEPDWKRRLICGKNRSGATNVGKVLKWEGKTVSFAPGGGENYSR